MSMFTELLELINGILPKLLPDEQAKVLTKIEELKEKRDANYRKALAKLADVAPADSIPALNALYSELHDSL